jgi:hypothetical protein
MNSLSFGPPQPDSRFKIATDCPYKTSDIYEFLLLRAGPASTTHKFAFGPFSGYCPPCTTETVALVKKGWHDERRTGDPWFIVELLFRGVDG